MVTRLGVDPTECIGVEVTRTKKVEDGKPNRMFFYIKFATADDALLVVANTGIETGMRFYFSKEELQTLKKGFAEKKIRVVSRNDVIT